MPTVDQFLAMCLAQRGDRYVLGAEASPADPDPDVFDCSELVEWACRRLDVTPTMPDGSGNQAAHCSRHRTMLPTVAAGIGTRGALLFRTPERGGTFAFGHVAVSLGDGSTIEARGSRWGVGVFPARGRTWTHAALVPGITYQPHQEEEQMTEAELAKLATILENRLRDDLAQLGEAVAAVADRVDTLARGGKGYQGHPVPEGGALGALTRLEQR